MWEPQRPRTLRVSTRIALQGPVTTAAEAPGKKIDFDLISRNTFYN